MASSLKDVSDQSSSCVHPISSCTSKSNISANSKSIKTDIDRSSNSNVCNPDFNRTDLLDSTDSQSETLSGEHKSSDSIPSSAQENNENISRSISQINHEIDAILARKLSSADLDSGKRLRKKLSTILAVEEAPAWRDIGEYEVLKRTKCRRIHSKLGQNKDLALFFRAGKFYAMEAWCSHMGGPLFEGDIEEYRGTCHIMCPWHAYMFELETGASEIGLKVALSSMIV
nr:Rieske domain-containing protein-like [Biomphalaria glabrata]